jgi:hypothetical protein
MVVACAALSLIAAACSRTLDAVVTNPCEVAAEIRFSGTIEAETKWFDRTVVPPTTSVVVKGVLADVGDDPVGYVEVRVAQSDPRVIPVPRGSEEELVTVVIPAAACPMG